MRLRVYVAGPISQGDRAENVRRGIEAGVRLLEAGYAPMIPHLTDFVEPDSTHGTERYEWWLEHDLAWIAVADALVRLPGESVGADREASYAHDLGIPVYESVEALLDHPPSKGDARFHRVLAELGRLHDRKQADYGRDGDPFANVRASNEWGVPAWVGAMIRATDKVRRLQAFARRGWLANEGAEDSLRDLAVYAIIALLLYQEVSNGRG